MKKGNGISLSQKELVYCYFFFFFYKVYCYFKEEENVENFYSVLSWTMDFDMNYMIIFLFTEYDTFFLGIR